MALHRHHLSCMCPLLMRVTEKTFCTTSFLRANKFCAYGKWWFVYVHIMVSWWLVLSLTFVWESEPVATLIPIHPLQSFPTTRFFSQQFSRLHVIKDFDLVEIFIVKEGQTSGELVIPPNAFVSRNILKIHPVWCLRWYTLCLTPCPVFLSASLFFHEGSRGA